MIDASFLQWNRSNLKLIFWYMGVGYPYRSHNWMSSIIPFKELIQGIQHTPPPLFFHTPFLHQIFPDFNFLGFEVCIVLRWRDWCIARFIFRSDEEVTNFGLLCKKGVFWQQFQQLITVCILIQIQNSQVLKSVIFSYDCVDVWHVF